jgi:hypothetical protein
MIRLTLPTLSALLHAYMGWRLLPALPGALAVSTAVLLVLSAWLVPQGLGRRGHGSAHRGLTIAGLVAMGWMSSLLVLTLLRDLLLGLAHAGHALGWWALNLPTLATDSAGTVLSGALALTLWGAWQARRRPPVVTVDVPIAGLPAGLQGFTIAQISDIHVGPTIRRPQLQAMVDAVNALQADAVAITGDLVDGSVAQLAEHVAPLAELKARHGAFFVTGNHEYYSGGSDWVAEVERLGVRVLMNEHVTLQHQGSPLVLAGVADYTAHHFEPSHRSDPQAALAGPRPTPAPRCCWPTSRAAPRLPPPASTCSSPATPTAASSGPGAGSCRCSSPSWPACTGCSRCGSTSAAAPATGARPSGSAPSEITLLTLVAA